MIRNYAFSVLAILPLTTLPTSTKGQDALAMGFVIHSLEVEPGVVFDFFLPSTIDTTQSMKANFCRVAADTLIRVNLTPDFPPGEPLVCFGDTILVTPVEIVWDDWILLDNFLHNKPVAMPIEVSGIRIASGYNAHAINGFHSWRVVGLRNDLGGLFKK